MTIYTHPPTQQDAILRKIRGSRDQTIPGYLAPQEQIPWVRGWERAIIELYQELYGIYVFKWP